MAQFPRVIPCLLMDSKRLIKTTKFREPVYVGDPINTVRVFNEKEVDELILLDIARSKVGDSPDFDLIGDIVGEAFMPIAYGGGVKSVDDASRLVTMGIEKIVVDTATHSSFSIVKELSERLGSQSVVVAVDCVRHRDGNYRLFSASNSETLNVDVVEHCEGAVAAGAGEILLNDVERDGTGSGYDAELIKIVSDVVSVPIIACGGAGEINDFKRAVDSGASAVAAGSMFVFFGKRRAVMINYPTRMEIAELFAGE